MTTEIKVENDLDDEDFDTTPIRIPRAEDNLFPDDYNDFTGASDDGLYANDR